MLRHQGNKGIYVRFFFFSYMAFITFSTKSQVLLRQALIDFTVRTDENYPNPIFIKTVSEESAFYKAGLRKDDQVLMINKNPLKDLLAYQKATQRWRAEMPVVLRIKRGLTILEIRCVPAARPPELIDGCVTIYDKATSNNGYDVRMIITKPAGIVGKKPVLFFIQWLSCDQVELDRNNMDGWAHLTEDLASKTGYVFVRTEKPGLGDSNGPDCSECDLKNEINAYKASFQKMLAYDFVDKNNIIIIGGSIGGTLAPVIAEDQPIKGIVSTGGFSTTWYEHMLDFERARLFYSGTKAEKIDSLMKKYSSFYYQYLIEKKKPTEIIRANASFKPIWYEGGDLQFGRPAKYYQQLQELNLSYYWNKVSCHVLVVYGEYDWIMSRAEQDNIIHLLNTKKPGMAELKIIPGMNHHFSKYSTAQEAFDEPFIKYESSGYNAIMKWLSLLTISK